MLIDNLNKYGKGENENKIEIMINKKVNNCVPFCFFVRF
nr:MAG TPA: hypothetical protein [Caudoviricetes sp.]